MGMQDPMSMLIGLKDMIPEMIDSGYFEDLDEDAVQELVAGFVE
jgi:hypothetical protein